MYIFICKDLVGCIRIYVCLYIYIYVCTSIHNVHIYCVHACLNGPDKVYFWIRYIYIYVDIYIYAWIDVMLTVCIQLYMAKTGNICAYSGHTIRRRVRNFVALGLYANIGRTSGSWYQLYYVINSAHVCRCLVYYVQC